MIRAFIVRLLIAALFSFSFTIARGHAQTPNDQELKFEPKHRINAHGNEFNGLAKSSDGKRLFVATEKGEIIVWNIAAQQTERTLRQNSAIHFVASLGESGEILAAGSNHYDPMHAVVRKWNVKTGTFVDLPGLDENSFLTALATDTRTGLAAVTTLDGAVIVWNLTTNKQVATWKLKDPPLTLALLGRTIYLATIDRSSGESAYVNGENAILKLNVDNPHQPPVEFPRRPKRLWTTLTASPDQRFLSASFRQEWTERTVIINLATRTEIGSFQGTASLWINPSKLVLFEWLDPSAIVHVLPRGRAQIVRQLKHMEDDTEGRAFELSGQVANTDGSKIWASYLKGPGLLEFDLATNKIKTLIQGPSGAYALSVSEKNGEARQILTGGADGYVRLWKLPDLLLIKEFHVAATGYFVGQVNLLADGRKAIVGVMRIRKRADRVIEPIEVLLLDLETGQQTKMAQVHWRADTAVVDDRLLYSAGDLVRITAIGDPQDTRELKTDGFVGTTRLSANRRWLAVPNEKSLTVFDLQTLQKKTIAAKARGWGPFVVTNDGRYVYQIANEGELTKWDLETGQASQTVLSQIRSVHSSVDFMMLANDDQWLVMTGNHGDIAIFDRPSERLLFYMRSAAAASYVEKVWIKGHHMIFTTDTGVMIEGTLVANKN